MAADGVCPECGQPVRDSAPLWTRPACWLRRLRLGALLVCCGLAASPFVRDASTAVERWLYLPVYGPVRQPAKVGQTVGPPPSCLWWEPIRGTILNLPSAVALVGVLLLTARGAGVPVAGRGWRRAARGLAWVTLGCLVLDVVNTAVRSEPHWMRCVLRPGGFAGGILCTAFVPLVLYYVMHLLRVVPNRVLAALGRVLVWVSILLATAWCLLLAIVCVEVMMQGPRFDRPYAFPTQWPPGTRVVEYVIVDESKTMTRVTTAPAELLARWQAWTTLDPRWWPWDGFLERYWKYIEYPHLAWTLTSAAFMLAAWVVLYGVVRRRRSIGVSFQPPIL